jgi:hypothetical protein
MFEINPSVVAITIPILFVLGAIAVTITALILDAGRKERKHKERLIAMEKGIELPEEPVKTSPPRYLAMRAWGFVFTFIGIATFIGITSEEGLKHGVWGLMPMSIGIALLVASFLEKKEIS